ncbi:hypothetical protein ES702_04921 [subsurface metagenome]
MIVTNLEYHLETKLVKKLDIMAKRCTNTRTRKDAVLIVEGSEGEGKTNTSEAIAYYLKYKMDRQIHMFFRLQSLMEFAQNTEEEIIIWDEPALDSLSTDWFKETNKDLIRLLMTCRKKRHFFIFNFVKFYKFSEYVVVDRALGLIHMYTRTKTNQSGRFVYVRMKALEGLFRTYRDKKIRAYRKYKSFGGSVPLIEHLIPQIGMSVEGKENATLEDYERLKDEAIQSIGRKPIKENKSKKDFDKLRCTISKVCLPLMNKEQLAKELGISRRTLHNWGKKEVIPQIP